MAASSSSHSLLPDVTRSSHEAALDARRKHRAMRRQRIRVLLEEEETFQIDHQDSSGDAPGLRATRLDFVPSPSELIWVSNRKSQKLQQQLDQSDPAKTTTHEDSEFFLSGSASTSCKAHHRHHVSTDSGWNPTSHTPSPSSTGIFLQNSQSLCFPANQAESLGNYRLNSFPACPSIPEESPEEHFARTPFTKSLFVHLPADNCPESPVPHSPADSHSSSSTLSAPTMSPRPPSVPCSPKRTPKGALGPRHGKHIKAVSSPRDHFGEFSPMSPGLMGAFSEASGLVKEKGQQESSLSGNCVIQSSLSLGTLPASGEASSSPTATRAAAYRRLQPRSSSIPYKREGQVWGKDEKHSDLGWIDQSGTSIGSCSESSCQGSSHKLGELLTQLTLDQPLPNRSTPPQSKPETSTLPQSALINAMQPQSMHDKLMPTTSMPALSAPVKSALGWSVTPMTAAVREQDGCSPLELKPAHGHSLQTPHTFHQQKHSPVEASMGSGITVVSAKPQSECEERAENNILGVRALSLDGYGKAKGNAFQVECEDGCRRNRSNSQSCHHRQMSLGVATSQNAFHLPWFASAAPKTRTHQETPGRAMTTDLGDYTWPFGYGQEQGLNRGCSGKEELQGTGLSFDEDASGFAKVMQFWKKLTEARRGTSHE